MSGHLFSVDGGGSSWVGTHMVVYKMRTFGRVCNKLWVQKAMPGLLLKIYCLFFPSSLSLHKVDMLRRWLRPLMEGQLAFLI